MSSKNDVCVICGEPGTERYGYPLCEHCTSAEVDGKAIIPGYVCEIAGGFSQSRGQWNQSNWQTHPGVIKRRQEVELQNNVVPREICPTTGRFMGEIKFWKGARKPTAKYFQQVGRVKRGPPVLSGIINNLIKKGNLAKPHVVLFKDEIEKLPSLMQPRAKHETTHTFSAELSSGEVVTMPSPGDDWTKVETVEHKRGNMRTSFVNLNGHSLVSKEHKDELGYVPKTLEFKTDLQKCWVHEYRRMFVKGAPILSITTWTRAVKPMRQKIEHYETCYSDLVADKCSSLKTPECAWPDNGRPKRLLG